MKIPGVISLVVNNDLCIGCGLCVYKCPNNALKMKWNSYGFLIPEVNENCDSTDSCLSVCPFNPNPDEEVRTENEISDLFLQTTKKSHPKIGKYTGIYAGYANDFRLSSSSGGIATYILTELLEKGIVNYVFSVKESEQEGVYYKYDISSSKEELLSASKTKYFPVTLETVMLEISKLNGKIAVVGVACFIKAIRLAQYKEPMLKEKIPFLVGIICGGVKSRFFTEYLAAKAGVSAINIRNPQFRVKDLSSTAGDYSFVCIDKKISETKQIKMKTVGDMWGTGLFKNNACDFCDDVTTELADISLGDAWLSPYYEEGAGTNVVVTRSLLADQLIQNGIKSNRLTVESLSLERFLISQQGSFNHRMKGLSVRIKQIKKRGLLLPPKRYGNECVTVDFRVVQILRMKVRQKSLDIWARNIDILMFDTNIKRYLNQLLLATKIYHFRHRITEQIKKSFSFCRISMKIIKNKV